MKFWLLQTLPVAGATYEPSMVIPTHIDPRKHVRHTCKEDGTCAECPDHFPTDELIDLAEALERGMEVQHIVFTNSLSPQVLDALAELDDPHAVATFAGIIREQAHLKHPLALAAAA